MPCWDSTHKSSRCSASLNTTPGYVFLGLQAWRRGGGCVRQGGSGVGGVRDEGRTMSSASISMIFESGMPSRLTERYMDSVLATWR